MKAETEYKDGEKEEEVTRGARRPGTHLALPAAAAGDDGKLRLLWLLIRCKFSWDLRSGCGV